jgi:hypothetical protein
MPFRPFLILLALTAIGGFAVAQEIAATAPKPASTSERAADEEDAPRPARANPRATPAATPAPTPVKKPNFIKRMFGAKTPVATPPPATPKARRPRRPVDDDEDRKKDDKKKDGDTKPAAAKPDATPEKPEETPPKPEATAPVEKPEVTAPPEPPAARKPAGKHGKTRATPAPAAKGAGKEDDAVARAVASGDPDAIEKAKYESAKTRANADGRVQELREKADNATSDEEGRKALRAYNQALFNKMRALDSSIEPRIDRMEKAVMRQLDKKE